MLILALALCPPSVPVTERCDVAVRTRDGKAIMYKDLVQGLWKQVLDGAEPQLINGFEEIRVYHMAWSFDGQRLAYTGGNATREIVLIENFR